MLQVDMTNIVPFDRLSFRFPERGGLVVLRGRNGKGKTRAQEAINRLVTGEGQVERLDEMATGLIEGLGITITLQKSVRRTGELEVTAIRGLGIEDLVDPGIDDPEKADLRRIRALIRIGNQRADLKQFAGLLPGGEDELKGVASAKATEANDLVDMASELKRNLESAARREADEANKEAGQALGCREAIEGIDLEAPYDAKALQETHTSTVTRKAALDQQARSYRQAVKARAQAEEALSKSAGEYKGPTVEQATIGATHAKETLVAKQAEVDRITTEIDELRHALKLSESCRDGAKSIADAANAALEAAKAHEKALADANSALGLTLPKAPDQDAIDAAGDAVDLAQQAIERGAVVRQARDKARSAIAHDREAEKHRERAEAFREAAKGTDDILSKALDSRYFHVHGTRLLVDHPERGFVPYHEESQGIKCKFAIYEVADKVGKLSGGKPAILKLKQEFFESLDPENVEAVRKHAEERGVVFYAAEATDGELRAEVFGDNLATSV